MPVLRLFLLGIAKTLSKVFGLATVSLFGRIPTEDDDRMATVGLLALTWIPAVAALFIPGAAEMLVPFAPDDETVLRTIAAVTVVGIPVIVGVMVGRFQNHQGLGSSHRRFEVLRGFRYVPVIAVTIVGVMVALPPMVFVRVMRGWEAGRLMVRVPEGDHVEAVDHVCEVLERAGHSVEPTDPPRVVAVLFRWLGHVLGDIFRLRVAPDLRILRGTDRAGGPFEVTVHAADLTIIGPREQVTRVHATLAEELDLRHIGVSWDDHTVELEHDIVALRERLEAGEEVDLDDISELVTRLGSSSLDQESWSAVRRALHRLERDVLRARLDLPDLEPAPIERARTSG